MDDRVMRSAAEAIAPATVTVRESTLFDAVCVALESGEFTQVREMMSDGGAGRCAWGVMREVLERAGLSEWTEQHPRIVGIERRAGAMLGYDGIESANDAGEHFAIIAAALRAAKREIEHREG
jgi:hypothetical protein